MIELSKEELLKGIKSADRMILSRAITLAESKKNEHRKLVNELIDSLSNDIGKSFRIGITGVPGVGKSTFIEAFGTHLIDQGHKVAVLTIDPSSKLSGGSILGDKTRMSKLALSNSAFIRPSPAGESLGGVARKTREAMLICEAAGFDIIIVETVGVGQSETAVSEMVDAFLLLMLSGAGDELQGIKKGIMESADIIAINKCDGDNISKSREAQMEYKRAIQMFPPKLNEWQTEVLTVSSLKGVGIDEMWDSLKKFKNKSVDTGYFNSNRKNQMVLWFESELEYLMKNEVIERYGLKIELNKLREMVANQSVSAFKAADQFLENLIRKFRIE